MSGRHCSTPAVLAFGNTIFIAQSASSSTSLMRPILPMSSSRRSSSCGKHGVHTTQGHAVSIAFQKNLVALSWQIFTTDMGSVCSRMILTHKSVINAWFFMFPPTFIARRNSTRLPLTAKKLSMGSSSRY